MIHFILCSNFTFRSIDFHNKLIAEWREIQILHKYRADSTADHTMNVQWGLVWPNQLSKNENRMPASSLLYYFWDEILQLKLSASIKLWMEENFKFKLTQIVPVLRSTFPGNLSMLRLDKVVRNSIFDWLGLPTTLHFKCPRSCICWITFYRFMCQCYYAPLPGFYFPLIKTAGKYSPYLDPAYNFVIKLQTSFQLWSTSLQKRKSCP